MDRARFDGLEIDATGSVVHTAPPGNAPSMPHGDLLQANGVAGGGRVRPSGKQHRREQAARRTRERMWNSPYNTYFADLDCTQPLTGGGRGCGSLLVIIYLNHRIRTFVRWF